MAERRNMPRRQYMQTEEQRFQFDQQLAALEKMLIKVRIGITRNNPRASEIDSSVLKEQLKILGTTLLKIGNGFQTQLEVNNPFGLSIVVQAMRLALQTLVNITKLVPFVRDSMGEELVRDASFLLCMIPQADIDPDSD